MHTYAITPLMAMCSSQYVPACACQLFAAIQVLAISCQCHFSFVTLPACGACFLLASCMWAALTDRLPTGVH